MKFRIVSEGYRKGKLDLTDEGFSRAALLMCRINRRKNLDIYLLDAVTGEILRIKRCTNSDMSDFVSDQYKELKRIHLSAIRKEQRR